MKFVPREMFLTRGVGVNKEKLNIVRVSSIFPPGRRISAAVLL